MNLITRFLCYFYQQIFRQPHFNTDCLHIIGHRLQHQLLIKKHGQIGKERKKEREKQNMTHLMQKGANNNSNNGKRLGTAIGWLLLANHPIITKFASFGQMRFFLYAICANMAIAQPIYQFEEKKMGIYATMMRVDEETRGWQREKQQHY